MKKKRGKNENIEIINKQLKEMYSMCNKKKLFYVNCFCSLVHHMHLFIIHHQLPNTYFLNEIFFYVNMEREWKKDVQNKKMWQLPNRTKIQLNDIEDQNTVFKLTLSCFLLYLRSPLNLVK